MSGLLRGMIAIQHAEFETTASPSGTGHYRQIWLAMRAHCSIADNINANLVLAAAFDHKVAGCLILVLENEFAMLATIAIDPNCAGMGIEHGLIEQGETEYRRLQMKELRQSPHVAMPENISLYDLLGGKGIGERLCTATTSRLNDIG